MTNTEIKKALYKQKPIANRSEIKDNVHYYDAIISPDDRAYFEVKFEVPETDMGDTTFEDTMDAKHLIRWIKN
tara:strand:+ start:2129 stop:2347 length:219 start_codon:yes stop_codon:yes gene_type:complete